MESRNVYLIKIWSSVQCLDALHFCTEFAPFTSACIEYLHAYKNFYYVTQLWFDPKHLILSLLVLSCPTEKIIFVKNLLHWQMLASCICMLIKAFTQCNTTWDLSKTSLHHKMVLFCWIFLSNNSLLCRLCVIFLENYICFMHLVTQRSSYPILFLMFYSKTHIAIALS